jgi:RNA polymerase subunit RPABC4/transcription elongation factor Spt4
MNCKHCNAELEEGVKLCPACGMAQEEPEIVV